MGNASDNNNQLGRSAKAIRIRSHGGRHPTCTALERRGEERGEETASEVMLIEGAQKAAVLIEVGPPSAKGRSSVTVGSATQASQGKEREGEGGAEESEDAKLSGAREEAGAE